MDNGNTCFKNGSEVMSLTGKLQQTLPEKREKLRRTVIRSFKAPRLEQTCRDAVMMLPPSPLRMCGKTSLSVLDLTYSLDLIVFQRKPVTNIQVTAAYTSY